MGKFRHPVLLGEQLNTEFGVLNLDEDGFVTNQDALGVTDEQMAGLPGLVNNDDFPIENHPVRPTVADAPPPEELSPADAPPPEELSPAVLEVVEELMADPGNFNSQGNLDLDILNSALAAKGFEKVKGSGRDALVDAVKAQ